MWCCSSGCCFRNWRCRARARGRSARPGRCSAKASVPLPLDRRQSSVTTHAGARSSLFLEFAASSIASVKQARVRALNGSVAGIRGRRGSLGPLLTAVSSNSLPGVGPRPRPADRPPLRTCSWAIRSTCSSTAVGRTTKGKTPLPSDANFRLDVNAAAPDHDAAALRYRCSLTRRLRRGA